MGKKSKTIEDSTKVELKDFGIKTDITTYDYVLWLETKQGIHFLKSIEKPNHNFGDYWTMHEAKSEIITRYANFRGA